MAKKPYMSVDIHPDSRPNIDEAWAVIHYGLVDDEAGKAIRTGEVRLANIVYPNVPSYTTDQIAASLMVSVALAFYAYVTPPARAELPGRLYTDTPAPSNQ